MDPLAAVPRSHGGRVFARPLRARRVRPPPNLVRPTGLLRQWQECGAAHDLPIAQPLGADTRNNAALRQYVPKHLADIEYRTLACADKAAAQADEHTLKDQGAYLFST